MLLGRIKRHGALPIREDQCSYVWQIAANDRCEWVKSTADCQVDSVLKYPIILFCTFGTVNLGLFWLGLVLLLLWLLYLFLILGTTADNFFCPSLSVIASVLRLSENIAGVTILAFGNGSPDIFTSLVVEEEERLIMFTELIGAGIFVTTIIAGSVAVFSPFRVQAKNFLRDCAIYMLATSWICYVVADEVVHLWEALSCIGLYALFIVIVVVMQKFESKGNRYNKQMPRLRDADALLAFVENRRGRTSEPPRLPKRSRPYGFTAKIDVAISREMNQDISKFIDSMDKNEFNDEDRVKVSSSRPRGLLSEFLYDVNPINSMEWKEASIFEKIILVLRAPFMLIFQLLIPVVNETAEKRGWSKLLNCLQLLLTFNVAFVILARDWRMKVGPIPLILIIVGILSIVTSVVFFLTSVDKIPRYHNALAFLGFLAAMLVVYLVAKEVMAVLQCVGFASGISDAMLGITLLAWGNSVGDLISNVTIARKGYPRMGYSACFGGPMFNTLIGFGLTYSISTAKSDNFSAKMRTSDMYMGCIAFLLCSLLTSLVYLNITGFAARKSYGYLLYTVYATFMLVNVLSEFHWILPLGTDHRE